MSRPRFAAIALLALATLAGCAPAATPAAAPAAVSAPTRAPTATAAPPTATVAPSPTPPPTFAEGSAIHGVDISGLTLAAAGEVLRAALAERPDELELRAGPARLDIPLDTIGLAADPAALLAEAEPALRSDEPAIVEPAPDEAALRERLEALAREVDVPAEIRVITSTDVLSRSFAYTPGLALDIDAAYKTVAAALADGAIDRPVKLELAPDEDAPHVPLERLQAEVADLSKQWKGVVGFHLYDTASGETATFQDGTVFAGASTIKVAIMLYAYVNVERFTPTQERWLKKMIVESDNLAANGLLAAGAGGEGTEYAFAGADKMSTMLQEKLGLQHTYLYVPYETTDYIKLYKPKYRCGPQGRVGEPPYTEMGACLRATPRSIAKIYELIDQCARGEGLLLDTFPKLNPRRCQEMLDRLATNGDKTRMLAGLPDDVRDEVRVEHKSGWIEDMQADAGIIRSPGGDYVAAIYVYKPLTGNRYLWADEVMAPAVAAFSRLAYTAYNPIRLDNEEVQ